MQRRFPLVLAVALAGLATAGIVFAGAGLSHAQQPPNRFFGTLTIDGSPAPVGTTVTAVINGRDCGSKVTDTAGQYSVDANAEGTTPGCGREGDIVTFRVGTRFAAQTSPFQVGVFLNLSLTVSGAGLPPVIATATPTATATPAATPSPTPTPEGPFNQSSLDLSGDRCIPAPDQGGCDDARLALWRGDTTAWTAQEQAAGRPAPDAVDIALLRERYRFDAGDPEARARMARFNGYAQVFITTIRYHGSIDGEGDEFIEIANLGGGAQDMTGWRVRAVESGVDMLFTEGTILEPGARCRFYTGAAREDSCPGSFELSGSGIWPDDAGNAELWNDAGQTLVQSARYVADPAAQPPAPALRGVR